MSSRRAGRIQNELRLWLRAKYGALASYSKSEIDLGRTALEFSSVDDALVAYTLFGPDLVPGFMDSIETSISTEELSVIINSLANGVGELVDLLGDDGI